MGMPTKKEVERARRAIADFYGPIGYPGPEDGSVLWAAKIIDEWVRGLSSVLDNAQANLGHWMSEQGMTNEQIANNEEILEIKSAILDIQ